MVVIPATVLTWLAISRPRELDRCALTPEERNRAIAAWETRQLEKAGRSVGSSDQARTATACEPLPPDTAFMLDLWGAPPPRRRYGALRAASASEARMFAWNRDIAEGMKKSPRSPPGATARAD